MKRVLSWIVLYLLGIVVSFFVSLVLGLGAYLLELVNELGTFLQIICYLLGGTSLLALLLAPATYGSMLTMSAAEAVYPSAKGLRYITLSVFMLVIHIIYILLGLANHTIHVSSIIMCIYYILLIVLSKEFRKEKPVL